MVQKRSSVAESNKTLNQHNLVPRPCKYNRRSSDNIGTSRIAIEDTMKTTLTEKQRVSERTAITEKPAPPRRDCLTSQEVLSEADRESEVGSIRPNAGQLGPNPMGATEVDGMLQLESPMQDNFWYSFLDPLPIDVDFGSTRPF
jgi:hypothetical protein